MCLPLLPYIYFLAREDFILSCSLAFHDSARSFLFLSLFGPRDVLQGIFVFLLIIHTYARGPTCIRTNTCSETRKQNIHASRKSLLPNKGFDAYYLVLPLQYISLHNRRFMSRARRTRHFARSAKRVRSAKQEEDKNKA